MVAAQFSASLSPLAPRQLQYSEESAIPADAVQAQLGHTALAVTGHETQPTSQPPWQMPHDPPAQLSHASTRSRSRTPPSDQEDSESEQAVDPVLEVDYF